MAEEQESEEIPETEGEREREEQEPKGEEKPVAPKGEPDWKAMARKHEREAKKARAEREALAAKLADREAADMSEQEKAIEAARQQARAEALTEAEKERRADRLELAIARVAGVKGVTVGDGDDAKTVKFADPDDVQMWLERQIAKGAIDADDIYTDGKIDEAALTDELVRLATDKPGWLTGAPNGKPTATPAGDPDAGKGQASKGSSVESELRAIQRGRQSSAA